MFDGNSVEAASFAGHKTKHHDAGFPVQQTIRPRPSCRQTRRAVVSFRGLRCVVCNRCCPSLSLSAHNRSTSNNGCRVSISCAVFWPVYSARLLPSFATGSSDPHFGKCSKCCVAVSLLADHLCRLHGAHITDISRTRDFSVCPLEISIVSLISEHTRYVTPLSSSPMTSASCC